MDTELAWRGGQQALLMLARGLRARGHRQYIACPERGDLADRAVAEGLLVLPARSRPLRQTLIAERIQIVHAHSGRGQNLAALSSLGLEVRRVVTRHVTFEPRNRLVHGLKYTFTCDGIIAVGEAVRGSLREAGVPAAKIEVIRTGVEIPATVADEPARIAARERLGVAPDAFVIGHMGAFTKEKGQDVAIAAASLCDAELRIHLVLGGDGALLSESRVQAAASGARVTFPGFVENRAEFYAALDVFVMPSRSEAWGLAALEAMAHGVPVIASDVGGLAEMIEPGSGWLVKAGDPRALAEAIMRAVRDRVGLRAAGLAARERARAFSLEKTVEQTEAFYRRVLAGRQAASLE